MQYDKKVTHSKNICRGVQVYVTNFSVQHTFSFFIDDIIDVKDVTDGS